MKTWDDIWKNYKGPSKAERWLIDERHKIIKNILNSLNLKKIKTLEVGCGYASNSRLLEKEGINTFCLDKSRKAIDTIKRDIKNSFYGDARELPFKKNSFNLVFSAGLLEHFSKPEKIIKEMARVVKNEGIVLNFVPGRYSIWQLYRILQGRKWKHGYEESYTHKKLSERIKESLRKEKFALVKSGGVDPFSVNGIFLKLFGIKLPIKKSLKNAYTKIYQAYKK